MKIKEQTRKLAAGCSKHCFEVVDRTDEVSSKHCFEVADRTDEVSSKHCFEVVDRTDEVSYIYIRQGEADVVWRDFRRVLNAEKLSEQEGNSHGQEANSKVSNHSRSGWGFSKFGTSIASHQEWKTYNQDSSRDAVFTWENGHWEHWRQTSKEKGNKARNGSVPRIGKLFILYPVFFLYQSLEWIFKKGFIGQELGRGFAFSVLDIGSIEGFFG